MMRQVDINIEPVELYKILKFEGMVHSGGAAKQVIEEGLVSANGAIELRKRKKIVDGDEISYADDTIRIRYKPAQA
jgi:ribosome-associated protein